ncbi:MAG: hypothetical protein NC935_06335 [Candidatus Omnitrophica bacterium]|nr:hypothetical protein [Candidatus Omnitrophota bacterium]
MNKKILCLLYGNFNTYLDDGGTLSLLTLLGKLKNSFECKVSIISSFFKNKN